MGVRGSQGCLGCRDCEMKFRILRRSRVKTRTKTLDFRRADFKTLQRIFLEQNHRVFTWRDDRYSRITSPKPGKDLTRRKTSKGSRRPVWQIKKMLS